MILISPHDLCRAGARNQSKPPQALLLLGDLRQLPGDTILSKRLCLQRVNVAGCESPGIIFWRASLDHIDQIIHAFMMTVIKHRQTLAGISNALFVIGVLSGPSVVHAQIEFKPKVCPLSESQTQNSIAAYAKMVPTFTKQERCFNCHGGVNPFADPTNHGGGTISKKDEENCNECHGSLPQPEKAKNAKWTLPFLPEHSFVNRDAKSLCESMKKVLPTGKLFVGHIRNDNGGTDFNSVAFAGTRGLNEVGRILAFKQPYRPEPIVGITHEQLLAQAQAWVDTMGGEFEGDERCGCEPVKQAIDVYYDARLVMGTMVQEFATMGPAKIPITFHDDRTFDGEGYFPFAAKGVVRAGPGECAGQSQGGMKIKVFGSAVEEFMNNHMLIEVTNLTPETGSTAEQCNFPPYGGVFPLRGGDKASFGFSIVGLMGETSDTPVPLPAPGMIATLRVKVVDLNAGPGNPK
jgi:hypothetical protein